MSNETEIRSRFWKELKSERAIMPGIDGAPGGGMQPMTALVEDEGGPMWIFTSRETDADHAKIWLNAMPPGAAIEWLLRSDPKESYRDKVAKVSL